LGCVYIVSDGTLTITMNPYAPPTAEVNDVAPIQVGQTPFFAVSVFKLTLMSLCTLSLYQVYWFYRNWKLIAEREQIDIIPAARAIFAVFYCYQCFERIRDFDGRLPQKSRLAAAPLAAGWILATIMCKLSDPYWLISLASVLFLLPAQMQANQINATMAPDHVPNSKFTLWNWVALVFGGILLALGVMGAFLPK
jgi:hypothetical protein